MTALWDKVVHFCFLSSPSSPSHQRYERSMHSSLSLGVLEALGESAVAGERDFAIAFRVEPFVKRRLFEKRRTLRGISSSSELGGESRFVAELRIVKKVEGG